MSIKYILTATSDVMISSTVSTSASFISESSTISSSTMSHVMVTSIGMQFVTEETSAPFIHIYSIAITSNKMTLSSIPMSTVRLSEESPTSTLSSSMSDMLTTSLAPSGMTFIINH